MDAQMTEVGVTRTAVGVRHDDVRPLGADDGHQLANRFVHGHKLWKLSGRAFQWVPRHAPSRGSPAGGGRIAYACRAGLEFLSTDRRQTFAATSGVSTALFEHLARFATRTGNEDRCHTPAAAYFSTVALPFEAS